jgi:hypothetical protein
MRSGKNASRAALAILFAALSVGAFPQGGPQAASLTTLDQIAAAGKENSLDYAKALLAASRAESNVPGLLKAKSSTLTGSYSYSGAKTAAGVPTASTASTDGVSASLSVPLVDQASLSASVSSDLSSKVSASIKPLAHSDTRTQAQIAYEKAVAAADEAGSGAGSDAVKAALKWMSLKRQLATQESAVSYREEAYKAAKAARELDPDNYSLDDVSTALKELSSARTALLKLQSSERSAATDLRALIGSAASDGDPVQALGMDDLSAALDALKASLPGIESSGAVEGYAVKSASLDLRSAASTATSTWLFDPDLSVSAGYSFPNKGDPVPSLSVSLTLSLDDLQGDAVARAKDELALAVKTLAKAKSVQEDSYAAAVGAVQSASIAVEAQKVSRDQAAEVRDEAAFLLGKGSYSVLENESAVLSFAQAEDSLYQSLADEYSAWLDLAALAGK